MSKLCIYPQDETTAFLKPIADVLQGDGFEVLDDENGRLCREGVEGHYEA